MDSATMAAWVQACAAVLVVVLTAATLFVLWGYARDTKTIARNSSEQIENSQLPFIGVVTKANPDRISNWAIKNQGSGTAVNISYLRYLGDKPPMMQWTTPLAPNEEYQLPRENERLMEEGFKVEYESLSGKKYRSTVQLLSGQMKTTFQKLD